MTIEDAGTKSVGKRIVKRHKREDSVAMCVAQLVHDTPGIFSLDLINATCALRPDLSRGAVSTAIFRAVTSGEVVREHVSGGVYKHWLRGQSRDALGACAWCGHAAVTRVIDEVDGNQEPACEVHASRGYGADTKAIRARLAKAERRLAELEAEATKTPAAEKKSARRTVDKITPRESVEEMHRELSFAHTALRSIVAILGRDDAGSSLDQVKSIAEKVLVGE